MPLPRVAPVELVRRIEPFDSPEHVFELKYDGFRALAEIEGGECRLISRKNHQYKSFANRCAWIVGNLRVTDAILDGEIVCLDQYGRSVFNDLFWRRGVPYLFAFARGARADMRQGRQGSRRIRGLVISLFKCGN